jgi:hypothetical protein
MEDKGNRYIVDINLLLHFYFKIEFTFKFIL